MVNGFINTGITSLEKRFSLTSQQTGFISSFYDIASLLLLIPVGYFGGRGSKPRWLGIGGFVSAIGCIVFASPHFLSGLYE